MGEVGRLHNKAADIANAYADRGYDPAATDPIILAEVEPFGVTLFDLGTAINFLQAFAGLVEGSAAAANPNYRGVINRFRQV